MIDILYEEIICMQCKRWRHQKILLIDAIVTRKIQVILIQVESS